MTAVRVHRSLDDRYSAQHGAVYLTGIQALARLPLEIRRADQRAGKATAAFISGYEGSPLAGYDTELARHPELLTEHDIVFQPAVNEELAATSVAGTQLASSQPDKRVDGVIGLWYGKSPGLDRASDAIRHANLMGTHPDGGVVALVGDDPAAKSSTVPGASELLLADLGLPTLYPADPQEVIDFGLHAAAISRVSGLWVAMKIVTNVADGSGTVDVSAQRFSPVRPDLAINGVAHRHEVSASMLQPTLGALERSRDGARLEIARRYAVVNGLNRVLHRHTGDRLGLVAAGKNFLDLRHALQMMGLDERELDTQGIRLLRLGMIHPLDPETINAFADGLSEIIVVEEKRPFLESAIKNVLYGRPGAPQVIGKQRPDGTPLFPFDGELDPDLIATTLTRRMTELGGFPAVEECQSTTRSPQKPVMLPLTTRTPYFCSGCPHNVSTQVPEGSLVGAGIGCHGMVTVMDERQVGQVTGLTQMGGEGAQWIGMAPFLRRTHLFQNLGDGTFHHSGSLAIRAAIAAGVDVTYKLLYNSAVAMTGGQQAVGVMSVEQICRAMAAEGVARIIVTTEDTSPLHRTKLPAIATVWPRDRLIEAQQTLATTRGVTLLIHDQECATELRRKRKRGIVADPVERAFINERVCEGCGDCGRKSNCLSVQPISTEFGRKTRIDQSSCNRDLSCLAGDCPSFLTVTPARRKQSPHPSAVDVSMLPDPPATDLHSHTTRITGIGGSGVVTLAQVLATAASLSGLHVRALDQTGLAQKGGAVVSDIKITKAATERAHKAAAGECDLYLGCDLLVAADARYLVACDPQRTVAVVSTSKVPTGRMVVDPTITYPAVEPIERALRSDTKKAVFLDARRAAIALLGEDQFANLILAGAALQSGALPIPAAAIEQAIELNAVKVDANIAAFRYGRLAVADPRAFAAAAYRQQPGGAPNQLSATAGRLVGAVGAEAGTELHRLLMIRVPDLIAYQNAAYAKRYSRYIAQLYQHELRCVPGSTAVTEAVARGLYKLMAYKDEYEVARLSLEPALRAAVHAEFGPGARIAYRLHPPLLRALGMRGKIELGPWFHPVFRLLAAMRRVRGTRLDPFGYARVRRMERALIEDYCATMSAVMANLHPDSLETAVEIAELPDLIRGYEMVKLAAVDSYRARQKELVGRLGTAETDPMSGRASTGDKDGVS
ncbi:indolepyruvate ferredoxin oxidoreductase family protein [Nocardia sp. NPDC047648]|uniref:indolepyruvate ferredoxin oxidoreductase family protein n=1 Tax=Nocardia sp. NPDC047648 TaxID=3155625 RepID=UPI0033F3AAC2